LKSFLSLFWIKIFANLDSSSQQLCNDNPVLSSRTAGQQKAVVISSAFGKDGAQLWSKMPQQICAALTVEYSGSILSHKMFAILRAAQHTLQDKNF
jgi:hypothetical protein